MSILGFSMDINTRNQIAKFYFEKSNQMLFWVDEHGLVIDCNPATLAALGYEKDQFVGLNIDQLDAELNADFRFQLLNELSHDASSTFQSNLLNRDGTVSAIDLVATLQVTEAGPALCFCGQPIEFKENLRNEVLESLATEKPLHEVLTLIIRLSEQTRHGMVGSILLLDERGRLVNGCANHLPKEYIDAIDGITPGPSMGSCGTAVHRQSPVLVEDVQNSPLWQPFLGIAKMANIRACWSFPIFSRCHDVLGTLAMYFSQPMKPTSRDLDLIRSLAVLAGIAIERANEQERLLTSELRNRSLIQSTSATVWVTNADGQFTSRQESWESYTGQSWDEYMGFGWKDSIHPDDQLRLVESWKSAVENPAPFESEGRLWHHATREYRHFEVRATPIIVDGETREWVGYTVDVQDRKLTQNRLLRNEAILAQAQDIAHLGSWVWTIDLDSVQCSQEFCRMHAIDPNDPICFESLIDTVSDQDRERVREAIADSIEDGNPVSIEYDISPVGCPRKTVFSKMKFERDREGKIIALIGAVVDVSDLRRTEQALLQSECQLRMITDSLPVLIAYIDTDYRFKFANAQFEELYEKPRSEIQDQHLREWMGDDSFAFAKPFFDDAMAGHVTTYEQRIVLGTDRSRIAEIRLVPDKNVEGAINGVYALVDDVTERRELEKEVLNVAENEHRRIGQDLHDSTGQELSGLGMIADTLLLKLMRTDAPEQDIAEKLALGIKRSLRQIKSVARGLNPVDVSSSGLMSALTEMAEHVEDLYSISCQFICRDEVRLKDNRVATQLFRIAQEASTNAAKHGCASKLTIQLSRTSKEVTLAVVDNGIGIPVPADRPQGMGLKSMNYRSDLIGGRLHVHRRPSGGTSVVCKVPSHNLNQSHSQQRKTSQHVRQFVSPHQEFSSD